MSLARNGSHTQHDYVQLVTQVTEKLLDAVDQISKKPSSMNIAGCSKGHSITGLAKRRVIAVEKLQEMLEIFSVPDLLSTPYENLATNAVIATELMRELEELGLLKKSITSNLDNLEDLRKNRNERDKNLRDIIDGLKKETNAIEDENYGEELRKLRKMKASIQKVFNKILDTKYSERKSDIKNIIEALYMEKSDKSEYVHVPESVSLESIMLLLNAKIIVQQEDDPYMIKLLIV